MRKVIKITESEIKEIVKREIKELMGVPKNIEGVAQKITMELFNRLENVITEKKDHYYFNLSINGEFSNIKISGVEFTIKIEEHPDAHTFMVAEFSITNNSEYDQSNHLLKYNHQSYPEIGNKIWAPIQWDVKSLIVFIYQKFNEYSISIAHELKHFNDRKKKPLENPRLYADYRGPQEVGFGIEPLDKFLYFMYYSHITEQLVRPTEIYMEIVNNKISKKKFIDFLLNNNVYKNYNQIKNFKYDGLKNELKTYIPEIDEILKKIDINDKKTDEEKINKILELCYTNIINRKGETLRRIMTTNFAETFIGFDGKKSEIFKKNIRNIQKFKNFEEFFKFQEKLFNFVGDKMIRKISKLYDMTNQDQEPIKK